MYSFPPPAPASISWWAIAADLAGIALALSAATGLLPRKGGLAAREKRLWLLTFLLLGAIAFVGLAFEGIRTELLIYLVLIWCIIGPTCCIALFSRACGQSPTARSVIRWLVIVGFVVLLWLPMISPAREAGRRTQCKNNLYNLGASFPHVSKNQRGFPAVLANGEPPLSWRTLVYFYPDRNDASPFDPKRPWDDPVNVELARARFEAFLCPSNFNPTDERGCYYTAYAAVTGPNTAFPDGEALPISQFTDGTSNTIFYGEAPGLKIVWTEPRDIDISTVPARINLPGHKRGESPGTFSSYHQPSGANVVFADGSVRFLSERISPAVLKALLTAKGQHPIEPGAF